MAIVPGGAKSALADALKLRRHQLDPPVQRAAGVIGVGADRREEAHARRTQPRLRDPKAKR